MKVLYITTVPTPYKVDFFEELGKLCELTVLFENETVSYRADGWMKNSFTNFRGFFLKGIKIKDIKISLEIKKFIKKEKYDSIVIGVYSTISQMIVQQFMINHKIKYIISSDGGIKKEDSGIKHFIKKHFISSASAWLSTGKITTNYLKYYGANLKNIYVYPFTSVSENDILEKPLSSREKEIYRIKLGIKENKVVLSVGQFIYRKGYDNLLKTCKNLDKNIGIYIVGGKPTEEYIQMQRELNLTNVYFVDFMKKEQLADYYKAADLFVLPTREDIWGLVINEAMAYGLPVITTNKCVAGMEMINENGKICNVDADWVKEITELITNKNRGMMAEKSIEIIKQYSIENMARLHYDIFSEIVKEEKNEYPCMW